jgi:hypothetical protein
MISEVPYGHLDVWESSLEALISALVGLVVLAAMKWLLSRVQSKADGSINAQLGAIRLNYGIELKVFSIVGLLLPIGLGVAVAASAKTDPGFVPMGSAIVAVFGVMSVCLTLESWMVRIYVYEDRLESFSPWRGPRVLKWMDITEVSYSDSMMWFVIKGRDGIVIRGHRYLHGLGALVDAIRTNVEPSRRTKANYAMNEIR